MPLVKIDMMEGRSDQEIRTFLDTVQETIVDAFGVPETDRYQIVTEHKPGRMIMLDTGLGFDRSDKVGAIHIFTSPRTPKMLKDVYAGFAKNLQDKCGLDPQDLFVAVTPNGVSDWSFGGGEAQYMTGKL
ncbi:tautomerase family protein [Altericroceibacterium endophyticum]|uniref:Tautomerase family protein n=1 Tax=Altericroceibacterium endophyticum TaxID=1808508 RepID=A0A6I4T3F9_9SPHN|nr:tautomerase family protein [Altericroceibacterium endophyticum]MXO64812.1 tautomerase family protein [Altericroceibacterium endophyticum]